MSMKKFLLSLLVMLASLAASAAVGDTFVIDQLKYTVTSEEDLEVSVEA